MSEKLVTTIISEQLENTEELMLDISRILRHSVMRNFETESDGKQRWARLAKSTLKQTRAERIYRQNSAKNRCSEAFRLRCARKVRRRRIHRSGNKLEIRRRAKLRDGISPQFLKNVYEAQKERGKRELLRKKQNELLAFAGASVSYPTPRTGKRNHKRRFRMD